MFILISALYNINEIYRIEGYCWDRSLLTNSVDPDQTAPKEQSDQGLHCLPYMQYICPHRQINYIVQTQMHCYFNGSFLVA